MVKNPPCSVRDVVQFLVREDPTCRGQLSLCTTQVSSRPQLKPAHPEPMLHNEKPRHCSDEWPLIAATREKPSAATKTSTATSKTDLL